MVLERRKDGDKMDWRATNGNKVDPRHMVGSRGERSHLRQLEASKTVEN